MKKYIIILSILIVGISIFASCTRAPQTEKKSGKSESEKQAEQKEQLEVWYSFAYQHYKNREYEKAIKEYQKILKVNPNYKDALEFLSNSYLRAGLEDSAKVVYKKAIENNPENGALYAGLGYIYHKNNKIDTALNYYKKAVKFNPRDAASADQIGKFYVKKGQFDSAIVYFRTAVERDSSKVEVWEKLTDLYETRRKYENVRECYEKLCVIKPNVDEYRLQAGKYYAKTGEFDTSIVMLKDYLEKNPKNGKAHHYLGLAYAQKGNHQKALKELNKAKEINPDNPKLMCDIGDAHMEMKNFATAMNYVKKALDIEEQYPFAYITAGRVWENYAMSQVPSDSSINMRIRLIFEKAIYYYRKASKDKKWKDLAKNKLSYLSSYEATKQKKQQFKHMEGELPNPKLENL